jgi:hypothetical protein
MKTPPIVSPEAWEAARLEMLVKEKAFTRARDRLAAERRRMPWMPVEKAYQFEGPKGTASLLDLFEDRRQLIVYRAFFEPGVAGWPDYACRGFRQPIPSSGERLRRESLKAKMGWDMLLLLGRPGRPRRPSERPRHHSGVGFGVHRGTWPQRTSPAQALLSRRRRSPELGIGWRPSVGGCRGCRLRKRIRRFRHAALTPQACHFPFIAGWPP